MDMKIVSDVPLPAKGWHSQKYPFAEMCVGDSIEFPPIEYQAAGNAARQLGYRRNWKFLMRKTKDGGRIWRLE